MAGKKPFIIVRKKSAGEFEILHQADTLRMARYWLQNLAQLNDAIFTTPSHSRYKGNGTPTYMCHLVNNRKMEYHKEEWLGLVGLDRVSPEIVFRPNETQIFEESGNNLKDNKQKILDLLNVNEKQLTILLSKVAKNANWQSYLTLESKNVYLVSLNSNSSYPLTISMNKKDVLNVDKKEDSNLKFVITPRTVL